MYITLMRGTPSATVLVAPQITIATASLRRNRRTLRVTKSAGGGGAATRKHSSVNMKNSAMSSATMAATSPARVPPVTLLVPPLVALKVSQKVVQTRSRMQMEEMLAVLTWALTQATWFLGYAEEEVEREARHGGRGAQGREDHKEEGDKEGRVQQRRDGLQVACHV